jgi:hypothetical protein
MDEEILVAVGSLPFFLPMQNLARPYYFDEESGTFL